MISGPTIPNTVHGVRELFTRHGGLVEHGLEVLCEDLVLGQGIDVDVLARDASGAPVFVFTVVPESLGGFAGRILGCRAWLQHNADWLTRGVDDPSLRMDLAPRFMVLGLEIPASLLDELQGLACPGLTVLQFCSYSIAGVRHLGVTELGASGSSAAGDAGLDPSPAAQAASGVAESAHDFTVPEGIQGSGERAVCARFLDLVSRIDPGLRVRGDRFHRQISFAGRPLAELAMQPQGLVLRIPGQDGVRPLTVDSCLQLVDLVVRQALQAPLGQAAPAAAEPTAAAPNPPSSEQPVASPRGDASTPPLVLDNPAETRPQPETRRFSLEPIRRSVAAAELSHEEFSALGENGSDEQQRS